MQPLSRMARRGLLIVLALGIGAPAAPAQVIEELTYESANQALALCDTLVRELIKGQLQRRTLDRANQQLTAAQLDLTRQTKALNQTLEALSTNAEANGAAIEQVKASLARAQKVAQRLRQLREHTGSIEGLKAAHARGTFERILAEAMTEAGTGRATLESVRTDLAGTGAEQVGTLTVDQIKIYEGELAFFVHVRGSGQDWVNDWVELKAGEDVPLFRQPVTPIRIRAALRDPQRRRLEESRDNARDVEFLEVSDAPPGVKFVYRGTSGTSTWVTNATYVWRKESAAESSSRVKAFAARDSCRFSRGDILEVFPDAATVQKIEFTVQANCAEWIRTSQLHGTNLTSKVQPEEGAPWSGSAWLVFSIFPK